MHPRIEVLSEKKLIGKRMSMSFADYRVGELWRAFMPLRKEIKHNVNNDLISLVQFAPDHFENFDPNNVFERWAAVEVDHFDHVPQELETSIIPAGLYAVFHYKGSSIYAAKFFNEIYNVWLPASNYVLDNRPHFEVLGMQYKNNDPASEEEIWIPIKNK